MAAPEASKSLLRQFAEGTQRSTKGQGALKCSLPFRFLMAGMFSTAALTPKPPKGGRSIKGEQRDRLCLPKHIGCLKQLNANGQKHRQGEPQSPSIKVVAKDEPTQPVKERRCDEQTGCPFGEFSEGFRRRMSADQTDGQKKQQ